MLRRKLRGRVKLSNGDRLFFVWLYWLFPSIFRALLIIRPLQKRSPNGPQISKYQSNYLKYLVELRGIEPLTSALRTRRSPS